MTFARRRWRNGAILLFFAVAIIILERAVDIAHFRSAFLSGWLLFSTIICLVIYRPRKFVSTIPIGSAVIWFQAHIYLGLLSIVLFFVHAGWQFPDGPVEIASATLFGIVAFSGIMGLFMVRTFPRRLTARGEQVIFERIPTFNAELHRKAETIVLNAAEETGSVTIQQFYFAQLHGYFEAPRNIIHHILSSNRPLFLTLAEMDNMERYLDPVERKHAADLRELIIKKSELDHQYALQFGMKAWLLVHVPATFAMLVFVLLHLVLVLAFGGGL